MNFYLLVEGKKTEAKIYPAWFSYLLSSYKRIHNFNEITDNCYFLYSANGYPSIIHEHLPNAVKDMKKVSKFHALVLALDAGELGYEKRMNEVIDFAKREKLLGTSFEFYVIIQNVCIETWLLGNRKIMTRNAKSPQLKEYIQHYNVLLNDPEKMERYEGFNTKEQFHNEYLMEVFKEKGITYNKNNPGDTKEKFYLDEIIKRIEKDKDHLTSFQKFLEFCKEANR